MPFKAKIAFKSADVTQQMEEKMNPEDIKLENLNKSLEYEKFSRNIIHMTDTDEIKIWLDISVNYT